MGLILKKQLWPHQKEALSKMRGKRAFALFMAMRLGKTLTLLTDFAEMEDEGHVQDLFVLAPGGVYKTWERAIQSDLPTSLLNRLTIHVWKSGTTKGRLKERDAFLRATGGPRALIMNIEALSSVQAARDLSMAFLSRPAMMAIDESTTIRNHASKRTKFIIKNLKPRARFRRILSGLPNPQSPLDLYAQFLFLSSTITGYTNFVAFRSQYAVVEDLTIGWGASERTIPQIMGWRNLLELKANIEPYVYRKRLDEVYDVPDKIYMTREVELSDRQKRIYKEVKDYATSEITSGKFVTATVVLAQMIRLHQIVCGYAVDELGEIHMLPEKRTETLIEMLNEYDGKAIIWASYDVNVNSIHQALEEEFGEGSCARFWGGNRSTREDEEARFLTDPDCRFIVATAAAGGRGRTWVNANLVVYYSNTYDLEHRSQSEERAQGVGKLDPVTYVDLISPGTVDEKFISALKSKINLAAAINGENWTKWLV